MFQREEIYLDYHATTPMAPAVKAAMTAAFDIIGNPSSVHAAGRAARKAVEDARVQVAALAGSRARDVVFTSGGTEANNLALFGAPAQSYLISPLEHEAILSAARELQARGKDVRFLKLDPQGQIDLNDLQAQLEGMTAPTLVSVMMVNNEMGLIQNLQPVIEITHAAGGYVHSDCVQAAGKIMLNAQQLDLDYMSLSAHKIAGPKGVGALVLKSVAPLKAQQFGGGQELGRRSGTENIPGIVGFGQASLLALESLAGQAHLAALRDRLEAGISEKASKAVIIGADMQRVSTVSCIAMPGVAGETQVMHMDLNGICISSGSACSSGKVKTSHVLAALGYGGDVSASSIRISLGAETTEAHIDAVVKAWLTLYDRKVSGEG